MTLLGTVLKFFYNSLWYKSCYRQIDNVLLRYIVHLILNLCATHLFSFTKTIPRNLFKKSSKVQINVFPRFVTSLERINSISTLFKMLFEKSPTLWFFACCQLQPSGISWKYVNSKCWFYTYTVWPQPILKKVRTWWQIPPQHQSTYVPRRPRISINWNPPFRPIFI